MTTEEARIVLATRKDEILNYVSEYHGDLSEKLYNDIVATKGKNVTAIISDMFDCAIDWVSEGIKP